MTNKINQLADLVNREIERLDLNGNPQELYEPIRYIMDLGGKRLRPVLTLMAYDLFHSDQSEAIKPAIAVELFHNFTLMHDDIMDQAPLRRGNPTVHKKWDDNVAILSGDVMLLKVYELISELPPPKLVPVLNAFTRCAIEVCEGQQSDINFEQLDLVSEEQYLEMIRQKTGVLLGFCLELGAILGGGENSSREHLKSFGVNMGLGFQLKDDLLDVYGDQAKFGKLVGGDIISNKKTFLLVRAIEKSKGDLRAKLLNWLKQPVFDSDQKVKEVTAIYNELGIQDLTQAKADSYFRTAFEWLRRVEIPEENKSNLKSFAEWLTNREN